MPSRNTIKEYAAESYYHIYARGGSRQKIFIDAADYKYFLSLFERYLSVEPKLSKTGEPYPHFHGRVVLYCYCLMSNHFHLLVFQKDDTGIEKLMRSIMTSYSRYFNRKYKRSGPLFETRYKASKISTDAYLEHITRYIHLNPRRWQTYRYSSLAYYMDPPKVPEWINTRRMLALFADTNEYYAFLADYESTRDALEEIKHDLADS